MDKIRKALNKFNEKQKEEIKKILILIKKRKFSTLDIKKLKNKDYIYRVRKGKIRIIFLMKKNRTKLINITNRSENTYK